MIDILGLIYQVIIGPLELLFEFIFSVSYKVFNDPGICIIILSIVMNLLALPLYRRANALQKEEKEKMNSLQDGMDHIKKTFKGDERLLVLQTFYRQNDYSPLHVFRGSISLFLQIPFFMAAYRMLSSLTLFNGKALGPISDLGSPDALLVIGGLTVNVLPILMTVINIISSSIYTKGAGIKEKLQLYGVAAVFLVLLYNSPAGLVFYWTCNNIFSLIKNAVPRVKLRIREPRFLSGMKADGKLFVLCCIYNALLAGLLIPSKVIASSTSGFVFMFHMVPPSVYLGWSTALSAGAFILWPCVVYYLGSVPGRKVYTILSVMLTILYSADYILFGREYGTMSSSLSFYIDDVAASLYLPLGITLMAFIALVVFLAKKYVYRFAVYPAVAGVIAALVLGMINIGKVNDNYGELGYMLDQADYAELSLSREKQNVVIIMLDRAPGFLLPYCFEEKPELISQFDGFTFYPNTVSFGAHTNLGAPALFGGYEYTPYAMNERSSELLVDKHNESLKVMPVMFLEGGFDVTVCDPSYAGYKHVPDLSIYDEYPGIDTYITDGRYDEMAGEEYEESSVLWKRNFFCYGLFRIMPPFLNTLLYDNGLYNNPDYENKYMFTPVTSPDGSVSRGYDPGFLRSYTVLEALPEITSVTDSDQGAFLMLVNYTAHSQQILKEPSYEPALVADNREYDAEHSDRFPTGDLRDWQMASYQDNMSSYILLGQWFDYLREQGVYDNTRIIIVADHGYDLGMVPGAVSGDLDTEFYNPVLLVKEINATGFTVSDEFMTNADTPFLAVRGLIEDPVNPFTGNPISMLPKSEGPILVSGSHEYDIQFNNGYVFTPGPWYEVQGNVLDPDCWEYGGEG